MLVHTDLDAALPPERTAGDEVGHALLAGRPLPVAACAVGRAIAACAAGRSDVSTEGLSADEATFVLLATRRFEQAAQRSSALGDGLFDALARTLVHGPLDGPKVLWVAVWDAFAFFQGAWGKLALGVLATHARSHVFGERREELPQTFRRALMSRWNA